MNLNKFNNVFEDYVKYRYPVGINYIQKIIKEKNYETILDIGCGTGNYLKSLYEYNPTLKLFGIDSSIKMLSKIPYNIKNTVVYIKPNTNFDKIVKKLTDNDKVDMILFNQVFHHFDKETIINTMKSCFNLLNPGGMIYINTYTNKQATYGYWWSYYFPIKDLSKFVNMVSESNDAIFNNFKPDKVLPIAKPIYSNNPFSVEGCNCSTMWNLLSVNEIMKIIEKIKEDCNNKNFKYIKLSDKFRLQNGQTTSYIFNKKKWH